MTNEAMPCFLFFLHVMTSPGFWKLKMERFNLYFGFGIEYFRWVHSQNFGSLIR